MSAAGYSGRPLPAKLGIKPASKVLAIGAPGSLKQLLQPWPDGASLDTRASQPQYGVILVFTHQRAALADALKRLLPLMSKDGGFWAAWPKRASKVPTDITEDVVREIALPIGLVDNKVCAIDDTWSGLRLVWRVENRR